MPDMIIFGAGASSGSDIFNVPPPASDLVDELISFQPHSWGQIGPRLLSLFREDFEKGMKKLSQKNPRSTAKLQRAMAEFFFRFAPSPDNLYRKLARRIRQSGWDGVLATFNYERLLELSLVFEGLQPVTGAPQTLNQIEVCLPHGCCHLFGESVEDSTSATAFNGEAVGTKEAVRAVFEPDEFRARICYGASPPIMSCFDRKKRNSCEVSFIAAQRNRFKEAVLSCSNIAIIGLKVRSRDKHIWGPLAQTSARLIYCSREAAAKKFKRWAKKWRSGTDKLFDGDFDKHFDDICNELGIGSGTSSAARKARSRAKAKKTARTYAKAWEGTEAKAHAEERARAEAEEKAKAKKEAEARAKAEAKAKAEEKAKARKESQARAKAEEKTKLYAEQIAAARTKASEMIAKFKAEAVETITSSVKSESEKRARLCANSIAQAETRLRAETQEKIKSYNGEIAKIKAKATKTIANQRAKLEAEVAKTIAAVKAEAAKAITGVKAGAEETVAEQKVKSEAEAAKAIAKVKTEAEEKANAYADTIARVKAQAEEAIAKQKAKSEAEAAEAIARVKAEAEQKVKKYTDTIARVKAQAEETIAKQKAKSEAEAAEAIARVKAEAEQKVKKYIDTIARVKAQAEEAIAEQKTGSEAEAADAIAGVKAVAEQKVKKYADTIAKVAMVAQETDEQEEKSESETEGKIKTYTDIMAEVKAQAEEKEKAYTDTTAEVKAQAEEAIASLKAEAAEAIVKVSTEAEEAIARVKSEVRQKAGAYADTATRVETEEKTATTNGSKERPASKTIQKMVESLAALPGECSLTALELSAKDITQKDVVWGTADDSVEDALAKMQRYDTGYMMIGRDGLLEGIISKSDLTGALSPYLRSTFAKWHQPVDDATLKIKIKWIMSKPVQTIRSDTSLAVILKNMRLSDGRCLPVVNEQGKVEGMVTVFDVFKALLKSNPDVSTAGKTLRVPPLLTKLKAAGQGQKPARRLDTAHAPC